MVGIKNLPDGVFLLRIVTPNRAEYIVIRDQGVSSSHVRAMVAPTILASLSII